MPEHDTEPKLSSCRTRRQTRRLLLPGALLLLTMGMFAGCRQTDLSQFHTEGTPIEESDIKPLKSDNTITSLDSTGTGPKEIPLAPGGLPVRSVSDSVESTQGTDTSGVTTAGGKELKLNYYSGYAHVYWRLNWIRKTILSGNLPYDFARSVKITRQELEELTRTIRRDGNYTVADEALTHLEKGLEHLSANQALEQASALTYSAPWSGGRSMMESYIEQGNLGFGGKSLEQKTYRASRDYDAEDEDYRPRRTASQPLTTATALTAAQQRAVTIALEYAGRYHASPEEKMRSEWKQAIEKINKLRDQLWLMNRPENSDGDSTYIGPISSQGTAGLDSGSGSFFRSSLYDTNGTDLPPAFGTEPADPFSSSPTVRESASPSTKGKP